MTGSSYERALADAGVGLEYLERHARMGGAARSDVVLTLIAGIREETTRAEKAEAALAEAQRQAAEAERAGIERAVAQLRKWAGEQPAATCDPAALLRQAATSLGALAPPSAPDPADYPYEAKLRESYGTDWRRTLWEAVNGKITAPPSASGSAETEGDKP